MSRMCWLLVVSVTMAGQPRQRKAPAANEWQTYNHDLRGTRFSPLTQINASNVAQLKLAWSFTTRGEAPPPNAAKGKGKGKGPPGGVGNQVVPIVVNGRMYISAGPYVIALEPDTGKEAWRFLLPQGNASQRGVAYWPGDRNNPARVIFTSGRNLYAVNAATGKLDPGFGKEGVTDMVTGYGGVPTIVGNTIMVGAATLETPQDANAQGDSRAFDARTGAKMWTFHSVPRPGEPGHETWLDEGWKDRSGTNVWGFQMSADTERGIIYMPLGSPSANYWGADRPGANLFGNSVVAIDANTGKYKWHFQTVHHDLWDFDNPPAPLLLDITVRGRKIAALVQTGKSGWMYILDRVTGKPVFGVEERPVAQGDVPGEWYSPTQPFPVKPGPLARMSFTKEDLVTAEDTTPEHAKACLDLYERSGGFYNAGPFTPFLFHEDGTPPRSTIIFPGATGGTNWGGMASDTRLGYVFAYTQDQGQVGWMERRKPGANYGFDAMQSKQPIDRASVDGPGPFHTFSARGGPAVGNAMLPCQKPPWGRLNAVNANTGEIVWQSVVGITEGLPAGKQNTGRAGGFAGPMATSGGLVFIGAVPDSRFRAFDSKTGKELWAVKLEATATANPITYQARDGKQYVAIVAGGTLLAYSLP
jgi:quinoprotein glucose dehydrogenase